MGNNNTISASGIFLRIFKELATSWPIWVRGGLLVARKEPKPLGLAYVLEEAVRKNPNGNAVLYEDVKISYKDFNNWANKIAHHLAEKGIKKGDAVAIFIENRPELLACVAAVTKLGAISAMLNTSQTGKVLVHSINLVKPKAVLIGEELVKIFNDVRKEVKVPADMIYFVANYGITSQGKAPKGYKNLSTEIADYSTENPPFAKITRRDPCFYIYTSGTTGLPKAAIFSHGRMMTAYTGFGIIAARLKRDETMYSTLPLYHSTALVMGWGAALVAAAGIAIRKKFSAREFWSDIRKYNSTSFCYVGEVCRYLMNQPPKSDDADNPAVRMIGTGLRPNIWNEFKERFGIPYVYEAYASSEGPMGCINFFNIDNSVGIASEEFAVVKYDKEEEKPIKNKKGFMIKVKRGEAGLLISKISEKVPFDGYTEKKDSEKCILRDVFKKGDAWFNSGDYMRDLGFRHLQFVDRLGDTYRWKGENVSTTEVENIIHSFPNITEAVAYGVEIPNTNGRAGMASITLESKNKKLDFAKLYKYLSESMPAYAVPLFIRIREAMATTGTFKYKKTDLKEEGYDPGKVKDPLYALLPGDKTYVKITPEVFKGILSGKYKY